MTKNESNIVIRCHDCGKIVKEIINNKIIRFAVFIELEEKNVICKECAAIKCNMLLRVNFDEIKHFIEVELYSLMIQYTKTNKVTRELAARIADLFGSKRSLHEYE